MKAFTTHLAKMTCSLKTYNFNEADAELKHSSLNLAINLTTEGAEEIDFYSRISNNLDARTKFIEYGYYSISDFIDKVGNDGAHPPNPTIPFFKGV